jgi:hypothetical protein
LVLRHGVVRVHYLSITGFGRMGGYPIPVFPIWEISLRRPKRFGACPLGTTSS